MSTSTTSSRSNGVGVVATAASCWALLAAWMLWGLGFDFMTSDPAIYWRWSLELSSRPYHDWWVPGYPIVLAASRAVTFGLLSPTATMLLVCGLFHAVGTRAAWRLAWAYDIERPERAALVFAVFPFVGVTYSVHPIADSMALATIMLAADAWARGRFVRFTCWTAVALLTHKATWFLFGPLALLALLFRPKAALWIFLAGAPVLVYLVLGALESGDWLWFLRWSQEHLMASDGGLPVFDAVLGTLLGQGAKGVVKGGVLLAAFTGGLVVLVWGLRHRDPLSGAMGGFVVLLGLVLNQYEALALLRFAKVLVVPLALLPSTRTAAASLGARLPGEWPFRLAVVLLFATNLAAAAYLTRYLA